MKHEVGDVTEDGLELIIKRNGYEIWLDYPEFGSMAPLFSLWLEPERECCIGECDTMEEAYQCASEWIDEASSS